MQMVTGIVTCLMPWFSGFLLFRFLQAVAVGGIMTVSFVLCKFSLIFIYINSKFVKTCTTEWDNLKQNELRKDITRGDHNHMAALQQRRSYIFITVEKSKILIKFISKFFKHYWGLKMSPLVSWIHRIYTWC